MSFFRTPLVALLAGVLIVPTTGATLAASAEPQPATELTASVAEPKTVRGKAAPTPRFSIAVLERDPARLGGSGAVDVALTRRGASDRPVRDVRVRISTPAGVTISKAAAAGWTCSKPKVGTRVVTCTHRGRIARGVTPAPIRVHIDVALDARDRSPITEVTARATWKGDPAASSSPWPKPWLVQDVGPVPVDAALGASLSSPAGRTVSLQTAGTPQARQVVLKGSITGIAGQSVDAQWFVKSGPKPRFLTPVNVRGAQDQLNQVLEYPDTLKGVVKSVIGLRVISDGRKVTRTITLTLNVSKQVGRSDGRDSRFMQLAAASRIPVPFEDFVDADDNRITIDPPQQPQPPGTEVTLSVRPRTGVAVASVAWYLVDEDDQSTFVTDEMSATFTVPAQPGDAQVVEVAAILTNGETQEEGYILYALEDEPAAVSTREEASEDDTANLAVFCSLATNVLEQNGRGTNDPITIDPPGGVTLTFTPKQADISKVFTEGGKCTGAGAMGISGATLEHPSAWTFKDVQASVDPTGLSVTRMGWVPTGSVILKIFKLAGGSGDVITWRGQVDSALTDGEWGLLAGTVDMQPFVDRFGQTVYGPEFLPLPGGWSIPKDGTKLLFLNKDTAAPADNTLRITQGVTGTKDGKGTFTADAVGGSLDNVDVSLSNIVLGDNGAGDSLVASGSGRFSLNAETAQRKITLKIECYRDKVLSPDCELVDRLMLKSFTVTLAETITLDAQANFRYADDQLFAFGVTGEYVNSKNWTLTGATSAPWNLGQGLTLDSLSASIQRTPRGDQEPDKTDLLVDVNGTLKGLTFGSAVDVTALTARVTNQCAAEETGCTPTEMRLQVDADIKALLPGTSTPTPFNVRAAANLSRLTFTFIGTAQDVAIGPQGMQVTKARFILTNDAATNTCRPKGSPAPAEGGYTASVGGEVVLLGSAFNVNAQFNADGYCLWGNSGGLDLGAPGLRATSGTLAYTNYAGGAVLVTDAPSTGTQVWPQASTIDISPNRIQLSGDFELPQSVRDYLGADGQVTYKANVGTNLKSAEFALTLQMKDDLVLYEQTQASPGTSIRSQVTMSSVDLAVSYNVSDLKAQLKLTAAGKVIVPRQDDPTVASITPVAVDGAFTISATGVEIAISAGVKTTDGAVENAFGQPGLTIRRLSVSLGFALPVPSAKAALNADATLPRTWGGSIGIQPGAPIKLAVSLDIAAPCLVIQIGEEEIAKRQRALDLANLGVITAKFFKLVLAPVGCTLPNVGGTPDKIGAGYAFVFDGEIVGSPVRLGFEVGLGDGLTVKALVDLPKPIDLYAVQLSNMDRTRGPKLDLDIDTKASKYDIDIDAYLEVGSVKYGVGVAVAVKGSLKTSDKNFITAQLKGYATGRLGPISLVIPEKRANGKTGLEVDLKIAKSDAAKDSDKQNFVRAGAELRLGIIGLSLVLEADLNYAEGQLVELKAVVDTTINIIVASLRARIQFDLCQGTLSPIKQDNSGSKCTRFTNLSGASPSIRVGLTGRYRILWWSKDYLWQAYNSEGKEGAPPKPDTPTPLDLATEMPDGVGNPSLSARYIYNNHDVFSRLSPNGSRLSPTVYLKVLEGKQVGDIPACDEARVGARAWEPSEEDANPAIEPLNPYPMQAGEKCGILAKAGVIYSSGNSSVFDVDIVCDEGICTGQPIGTVYPNGFRLAPRSSVAGDAARQQFDARAQTFTGLTTPPGFMPSGGILEKDGPSPAVIAGWDGASELRADAFSLKLINERGQNVWSFGTKTADKALSSHFELRGGQAGALLAQFTQQQPGVYVRSNGILVRVTKPADGVSVNPMLVVSDGMFTVYDGSIGRDTVLWGVKKDGSCFYNKDRVEKQDPNFCKK